MALNLLATAVVLLIPILSIFHQQLNILRLIQELIYCIVRETSSWMKNFDTVPITEWGIFILATGINNIAISTTPVV